ncbi:hypothetical protein RU639_003276 [Aspergillus parasiticus]
MRHRLPRFYVDVSHSHELRTKVCYFQNPQGSLLSFLGDTTLGHILFNFTSLMPKLPNYRRDTVQEPRQLWLMSIPAPWPLRVLSQNVMRISLYGIGIHHTH